MSSIHQALLMIGDEIRYWLSQRYPVAQPPEAYRANVSSTRGWFWQDVREAFTANLSVVSGALASIQRFYNDWPREAYTASVSLVSGALVTIQRLYNDWPREAYSANVSLVSGALVVIQQNYNNWPREAYASNISIVSGTLA